MPAPGPCLCFNLQSKLAMKPDWSEPLLTGLSLVERGELINWG